jgi:hypothetical protein
MLHQFGQERAPWQKFREYSQEDYWQDLSIIHLVTFFHRRFLKLHGKQGGLEFAIHFRGLFPPLGFTKV